MHNHLLNVFLGQYWQHGRLVARRSRWSLVQGTWRSSSRRMGCWTITYPRGRSEWIISHNFELATDCPWIVNSTCALSGEGVRLPCTPSSAWSEHCKGFPLCNQSLAIYWGILHVGPSSFAQWTDFSCKSEKREIRRRALPHRCIKVLQQVVFVTIVDVRLTMLCDRQMIA